MRHLPFVGNWRLWISEGPGAAIQPKAVERTFRTRPDAPIMLSFPGVEPGVGARLPAESGDDRTRVATAGGLEAYAGSAPITRASGKRRYVGRRFVKNNRLNHAGCLWAFATLSHSPGANAHERRRREPGDWHAQALRHLFNRLLGRLHHCLQNRVPFDAAIAFAPSAGPTEAVVT